MDVASILTSPTTWIFGGLGLLYSLYKYGTHTFDYFSNQGIPGPKPVPFFGNLWGIWRKNFVRHDADLVKEYGKTFGFFEGLTPNLFVSDAEFIKNVLVKDFDHFINRRSFEVRSKYFRKMISLIRDDEWKEVRSSVSPTFTTGKIKRMSVLIKRCSDLLADKLMKAAGESGKVNAKEVFSTFTMDVISKCAFGMEINNLGQEDDPFMKNAKFIFNQPVNKSPFIVIPFAFPKLSALLGDRIFVTKEFMFFVDLLINITKERASSDKKYNDFIEVAAESISEIVREVNGNQVQFTREEVDEIVIAQSSIFLLAGFDTTATTLTNACYLLAKNPHVQERLHEEIMSKVEQYGDVSHEMILDFPYVDQVVHEVLRMYSPVPRLERECNKDITYNGIVIKKGIIISVPTYSVHYSEEYYPNPEKFDPDRWAPENKHNLNPNTFLPFGLGPRNCIGMRFAMEELKIALCSIVKKLRFYPVEETPDKLEFEDGLLTVIQPIHAIVGVELRA
nr:CYP360A3 protein [Diaphanosoma celebensis]